MGVKDPKSGEDFIQALDALIASVGCADLRMSDAGITKEELKGYPKRVHEVLGGDITADPLPLSDADYLEIFEESYK
jgi:alcohol dehydrogenase